MVGSLQVSFLVALYSKQGREDVEVVFEKASKEIVRVGYFGEKFFWKKGTQVNDERVKK